MAYMNILRYIIHRDYWEGLKVVPIVMAAEMMMGIYFNLSFWYKLTDKTIWGAVFSITGCLVLLTVNVLFVPKFGYMACAWGGFAGYGVAMTLSYLVGQKKAPVPYPMGRMALYLLLAGVLLIGITLSNQRLGFWSAMGVNTLLIAIYCLFLLKKERLLSSGRSCRPSPCRAARSSGVWQTGISRCRVVPEVAHGSVVLVDRG